MEDRNPGIKTVLLIEPSMRDMVEPDAAPSLMVNTLEKAAQSAGLNYVNLYPAFAEVGAQTMYNAYDDHWSVGGQNFAAILTANKIMNILQTQTA